MFDSMFRLTRSARNTPVGPGVTLFAFEMVLCCDCFFFNVSFETLFSKTEDHRVGCPVD